MDEYQLTPLSVEQCKDLLKIVGKMLCVKAELISTRLLSKEDKEDMLAGKVSIESLVTAVRVWRDHGMPNYAEGSYSRYMPPENLPMRQYRGNGK